MKTLEVRPEISAKEVATRLVSICGGRKEAMSTLVEGSRGLQGFGSLFYNVSLEIPSVKTYSRDAYRLLSRRRDRKGGTPAIRRYL